MTTLESFRALTKLTAPVELRKYEKWWEQQPRDKFGKWTSGFSHGVFAPSDEDNDEPVDPPENPKENWKSEPGWMGASAQHGISADHPALDGATGAPDSGYISADHANDIKDSATMDVAFEGSNNVIQHLESGDFAAAKKLVHANPSIIAALAHREYDNEKQAKSAMSFLNAVTDGTWVQHGTNGKLLAQDHDAIKENPLAAIAAQNNVTPQPKPVGAPKLVDLDTVEKPQPGTVGHANAVADAHGIHVALETGDVASARKLALQNPQSLLALKSMEHGTSLEAKSAAAFLHLMTGKTFAQHGKKVKQVKGAVPSSLWSPPKFNGTGAPDYQPPVSPDALPEPASIIPPPGQPLPQSEESQAKAPEATAAWTAVEAKPIEGKKVGGTNPGGFYELGDGTKGYAKFYSNVEQMQTEFMANQVYKKLGINAPDSRLVTIDGKKAIFSPLIENGHQNTGGVTADSTFKLQAHPQVLNGFAADAILANHDVVGLTHDNIMFTPDGQAHRLDNGGALKYRAQGALKSNYTKDAVPELDTMRDAKFGAGKIFQGLGDKIVADQAVHVAQTVKPDDVAKIVADAGFTGKDATEHADMINGRIKAALKWAIPKLKTPEQQANAMALASSITPQESEKPSIPAPPVGDKLLSGVSQDPHIAKVAKLALSASFAADIPTSVYAAIGDGDEHAFAKAATSNAATLIAMAQKKWTKPWPAIKMASILTYLTGNPYKATATEGGIKVVKGNYGFEVAQPDPEAKMPTAQGVAATEKPDTPAAPISEKAKLAAAKANLDYSVFNVPQAHMTWATNHVNFLEKVAEQHGVFSPYVDSQAKSLAENAVKHPTVMAALTKMEIPEAIQPALHGALKEAGIDSTVDPATNKMTLHGVHPKHVAQALALTPGTHNSTAAVPGQSNEHLGPLFLQGDFKPITSWAARDIKRLATKMGQSGPNGVYPKHYVQSFESQPNILHHLATTPMSKQTAERIALAFAVNGKEYGAKAVKLPGVPKYVIHFSSKDANAVTSSGKFDEAFIDKHGGANPLTSTTPLALKLKNQHLLPEGVKANDLVRPEDDPEGHETQAQALERIKGINPESAAFLAAHYAHQNAQPVHPLAHTQNTFLGATAKLASPYLRAHEVMNRVLNHERKLPTGVTPSMLHAETPEEQQAAISEAHQNAGWGGDVDAAKWLGDYFAHRQEASSPSVNQFIKPDDIAPTAIPSGTAHSGFQNPSVFGPGTPHNDSLTHNSSGTHAFQVSDTPGRTTAHDASLTPQRTSPIVDNPDVFGSVAHDPTHLSLPAGVHTLKQVGAAAKTKAYQVIKPLLREHQEALAKGDAQATADPHGSLPAAGVHVASQHGYKLTQSLFKPMLEAARAATPSEQVIRAMMKSNDDSLLSSRGNAVSKEIFTGIARQLGIPISAENEVKQCLDAWGGNAQSGGAMKLRVASNLLRGRAPWENVSINKDDKSAVSQAKMLAKQCTPDFLKAFLLHKAVTQAAMERVANENGHVSFVRGIGSDVATSMMAKTAEKALAMGKAGSKYSAAEQSLAGYGPRAIGGFGGGAWLHRVARPEDVWHSYTSSPASIGGYEGEMENFIASDNGGPTFTLAHHKDVHPDGNFVTPGGYGSPSPGFANWKKIQKALEAARDVIKPLEGTEPPIPVPPDREGWYAWTPPSWEPSQAHVDAWHDAFTDADGVVRFDASRDDGWNAQGRDPELRRAALAGELPAA